MTATVVADWRSSPWSGTDHGATAEAGCIPILMVAIRESLIESEWGRQRGSIREALEEAWKECSVPDWDGYGAAPADFFSAVWAEKIVSLLLPTIGLPHFSFDPQGDALLEWYEAPDRVVDMSVGSNGEIRYAAIIGGTRLTGIEEFSDALPAGLAGVARRWAV